MYLFPAGAEKKRSFKDYRICSKTVRSRREGQIFSRLKPCMR
jgi:hypothetical protein